MRRTTAAAAAAALLAIAALALALAGCGTAKVAAPERPVATITEADVRAWVAEADSNDSAEPAPAADSARLMDMRALVGDSLAGAAASGGDVNDAFGGDPISRARVLAAGVEWKAFSAGTDAELYAAMDKWNEELPADGGVTDAMQLTGIAIMPLAMLGESGEGSTTTPTVAIDGTRVTVTVDDASPGKHSVAYEFARGAGGKVRLVGIDRESLARDMAAVRPAEGIQP